MAEGIPFEIPPQPDDFSCGPTCLQAVYQFYGDHLPLQRVIDEVRTLDEGGTLAVFLGNHALRRGYGAAITTYNLRLFDPSWFDGDGDARPDVIQRLRQQARAKRRTRLRRATAGYLEFLRLGGALRFEDLTPDLVSGHLARGRPILTGLSATFLYRLPREFGPEDDYDDIQGEPSGHFVVLCGYDEASSEVLVADPMQDENPYSASGIYRVPLVRVLNAVLLGVLTHDANLLFLEPPAAVERM